MKFVTPLSFDEISALEHLYKNHPKHRKEIANASSTHEQ